MATINQDESPYSFDAVPCWPCELGVHLHNGLDVCRFDHSIMTPS